MRKFLLIGVLVLGLAGLAFAAVGVKSAGVIVDKTETMDYTGGLVATKSGTDVVVGITGLIVDPALYSASAGAGGSKSLRISVDGTIYGF